MFTQIFTILEIILVVALIICAIFLFSKRIREGEWSHLLIVIMIALSIFCILPLLGLLFKSIVGELIFIGLCIFVYKVFIKKEKK